MRYPFKYPKLYGELAMQGKTKKELASVLHITIAGLRYKQSVETDGDFRGEEMRAAAFYLCKSIDYLFAAETPFLVLPEFEQNVMDTSPAQSASTISASRAM